MIFLTIIFFFQSLGNSMMLIIIQDYLGIDQLIGSKFIILTKKIIRLMAHSQPNTPRPEQDESRRSFSVSQPIRHVVRGRASVFAAETGPYFSSTRSFENLFGSNKQDL